LVVEYVVIGLGHVQTILKAWTALVGSLLHPFGDKDYSRPNYFGYSKTDF